MQKLCLVAFNSKVGMELILDCYSLEMQKYFDTFLISDNSYIPSNKNTKIYRLSRRGNQIQMALDFLNPLVTFQLIGLLIAEKPHLVYIISAHPLNTVIVLCSKIVSYFMGCKIIIISHIHDVQPHFKTRGSFFINFFQTLQVRFSDKITVYGDHLRKKAQHHFKISSENIFSYIHGANRSTSSRTYNLSTISHNSTKQISLVGRIDYYKGIDIFLNVAKTLQMTDKYHWLIAGSGDLSPYLHDIESIPNLTIINRFLSNDEIDEILLKSYLLVLPYKEASQSGMTPVAYYNSCPVIVHDVGGLSEIVETGRTGIVVSPHDVSELTNAIKFLCDNPSLREEMARNCHIYYQEKLSWDKILFDVSCYLKLLD